MRYKKIDPATYGDERYRALSPPPPSGRFLWLYLLTGPHTCALPGLFAAGEAGLAEALGWPLAGFRRVFREIADQGMAKADWAARVVWIPKCIRYNEPESPSVVKSWLRWLDEIPECDLKRQAVQELGRYLVGMGPGWAAAWTPACPTACGTAPGLPAPHQEQEQEQEQEQKQEQVRDSLPLPPLSPSVAKSGKPSRRHPDRAWGRA